MKNRKSNSRKGKSSNFSKLIEPTQAKAEYSPREWPAKYLNFLKSYPNSFLIISKIQ